MVNTWLFTAIILTELCGRIIETKFWLINYCAFFSVELFRRAFDPEVYNYSVLKAERTLKDN